MARKRFKQDKIKIYCSISSLLQFYLDGVIFRFTFFVHSIFISSHPTSACNVYFYTVNERPNLGECVLMLGAINRHTRRIDFVLRKLLCLHKFALIFSFTLDSSAREYKGIETSTPLFVRYQASDGLVVWSTNKQLLNTFLYES